MRGGGGVRYRIQPTIWPSGAARPGIWNRSEQPAGLLLVNVCQRLINTQEFALFKPTDTFMCCPVWEDGDSLCSQPARLFSWTHLEWRSRSWPWRTDAQLKATTPGLFWNLLAGGKSPNRRKWATFLAALFGSTYLSQPFPTWSLLSPKMLFHNDWRPSGC